MEGYGRKSRYFRRRCGLWRDDHRCGGVTEAEKSIRSSDSCGAIRFTRPVGWRRGVHQIQGIGAGFVPDNFRRSVVDEVVRVSSQD